MTSISQNCTQFQVGTRIVHPDDIEEVIDLHRFERNWDEVVINIEEFLHLVEHSESAAASSQHDSESLVQAFYWAAISECMYEGKKDYLIAIECAQKSINFNADYCDGRIILSRILLDVCAPLLRGYQDAESGELIDAMPALDASIVLANALKSQQEAPWGILETDKAILLQVFAEGPVRYSRMLLHILDAMSTADQLLSCNRMLALTKRESGEIKGSDNADLLATLIMTTSLVLLLPVRVDDILQQHGHMKISQYRMWLHVDAISTRGVIHELLGALPQALTDASLLAIGSAHMETLPETCRSTILDAAARVPLLEAASGQVKEALASYERCARMNARQRYTLPPSILLGHKVEVALLLLNRARHAEMSVDHAASEDMSKAIGLLSSVRTDMSAPPVKESENYKPLVALEYHPLSLTQFLPLPPCIPSKSAALVNSRTISTLLAALFLWQSNSDENAQRAAEVLEWGCAAEVDASSDLVYFYARALMRACGEKVDHAINLLRQSHTFLLQERSRASALREDGAAGTAHQRYRIAAKTISRPRSVANQRFPPVRYPLERAVEQSVASLLRWLGFYTPPTAQPWLPATTLVDLLLDTGDSKSAISDARLVCEGLYSNDSQLIMDAVGCIKNQVESMDGYFDPCSPSYSLMTRYSNSGEAGLEDVASPTVTVDLGLERNKGLLELIHRLGRSYAAVGRLRETTALDCRKHLLIALRCFNIVLRGSGHNGCDYESIQQEACLQRSVVLAEIGEVSLATKYVRESLGLGTETPPEIQQGLATAATISSPSPVSPQISIVSQGHATKLMHLLALLLTTVGEDDPESVGSAVVIAQRAAAAEENFMTRMNIDVTTAMLEYGAGEMDSALVTVRSILHFFATTERERRERYGRFEEAPAAAEPVAQSPFKTRAPAPAKHGQNVTQLYNLGHTRITREYKRRSVDILLGACRILRMAGDQHGAYSCVEEAWSILFTAADCSNIDLVGESGILEHRRREVMRSMPTLLGWRLPECAGWGTYKTDLPDCQARVLVEAANVVLTRPSCDSHDLSAEVEAIRDAKARAERLYRMALAIYPSCLEALLAVAELELVKGAGGDCSQGKEEVRLASLVVSPSSSHLRPPLPHSSTNGESFQAISGHARQGEVTQSENERPLKFSLGECGHASRGYEYALQALRVSELNADAWCLFGKACERTRLNDRAMEAFMLAIETAKFSSLRPFSSILD